MQQQVLIINHAYSDDILCDSHTTGVYQLFVLTEKSMYMHHGSTYDSAYNTKMYAYARTDYSPPSSSPRYQHED